MVRRGVGISECDTRHVAHSQPLQLVAYLKISHVLRVYKCVSVDGLCWISSTSNQCPHPHSLAFVFFPGFPIFELLATWLPNA